jgi:hypothetical protein
VVIEQMTRAQVRKLADREAKQMLSVSGAVAFQMLDRGDLDGTMAEAEFSMLRFLMSK